MNAYNANEMQLQWESLVKLGAAPLRIEPRGKAAIEKGWSSAPKRNLAHFNLDLKPGENVGIRLGAPSDTPFGYLHCIDFDLRDPTQAGEASAALDAALAQHARAFVVNTGSGTGQHLFFFAPEPLDSHTISKGHGWEVALKGTGTYVVAPGSTHPSGGRYEWAKGKRLEPDTLELIPPPKIELAPLRKDAPQRDPLDDLLGSNFTPVDWGQVESALQAMKDADDRDVWLTIGQALHHASSGTDEGYQRWCDWSQQSEKYDERDQRRTWKSFGKSHGTPVTLGSLFKLAQDTTGWRPSLLILDSDFDDLPAPPVAPAKLYRAKSGDLKPMLHNAIEVLAQVNVKKGYGIRHNLMTLRDEWRSGVIGDADLALIRVAIEQAGFHGVGSELTTQAVRAVAKREQYHPVRGHLTTLRHDGKRRLDTWLTQYLNVDDTPYTRAVGRAFLIAMVARVMRPGCKHDHVLVLRGPQGLRKSTVCRILGGDWFGDNMPSIRDGGKEAGLYLRGHWLVELAELAPSRKADAEDLKAFLTRAADEIRAPYARTSDVVERQCVFVGTTNEESILRDITGGRRFWPVTVKSLIDTDYLTRDRGQLLAEAVSAFRAGEQWHLSPEHERMAAEVQEESREEDPWESLIRDYLDKGLFDDRPRDQVRTSDILEALHVARGQQTSAMGRKVGAIMRKLNWSNVKDSRGNRVWRRG